MIEMTLEAPVAGNGRVALVTGAARGIGLGIAAWLISVGFCVLFSQVAAFTYAGLHLGLPPFNLGPAALGTLYMVFLLALG